MLYSSFTFPIPPSPGSLVSALLFFGWVVPTDSLSLAPLKMVWRIRQVALCCLRKLLTVLIHKGSRLAAMQFDDLVNRFHQAFADLFFLKCGLKGSDHKPNCPEGGMPPPSPPQEGAAFGGDDGPWVGDAADDLVFVPAAL
jgi:hypothetical protein